MYSDKVSQKEGSKQVGRETQAIHLTMFIYLVKATNSIDGWSWMTNTCINPQDLNDQSQKKFFFLYRIVKFAIPRQVSPGKGMVVHQPIEDFRQLIYLVILCLYYIISYYIVSLYE